MYIVRINQKSYYMNKHDNNNPSNTEMSKELLYNDIQTSTIINPLVPINTYIEAKQALTRSRNASRSHENIEPSKNGRE